MTTNIAANPTSSPDVFEQHEAELKAAREKALFDIDDEKRKELRKSQRRKPPTKEVIGTQTFVQAEIEALFLHARDLAKWMLFLEGNNLYGDEIAQVVLAGKHAVNSVMHRIVFLKVQKITKSLKSNMLSKAKQHVRKLMIADNVLNVSKEPAAIRAIIKKNYDEDNFYQIWYYMDDLMSVEKSPPEAWRFIQNMYVNFVVRLKLHLDQSSTKGMRTSYENSDRDFKDFMNIYIGRIHKAIPGTKRDSFAQRTRIERKKSAAKKAAEEMVDDSDDDRFEILE